jgi:hypothetical protein
MLSEWKDALLSAIEYARVIVVVLGRISQRDSGRWMAQKWRWVFVEDVEVELRCPFFGGIDRVVR